MDNSFSICKNCGRPLHPGEKFCGGCGSPAVSVQNLQEAAAQNKTVLYLPDDDKDEKQSAQWNDRYDSPQPADTHRNINSYMQPEPYAAYPSNNGYAQNTDVRSAGGYSEPPQYQPPLQQPGEFDYNAPAQYSAQAQEDDYPQPDEYYPRPAEYSIPQTYPGRATQKSGKTKKVLFIVLVAAIVVLLIEGVLAVLYMTDVTSSFFPVKDVIQWVKGEDDDAQDASEQTTQDSANVQGYTPEYTSSNASADWTAATTAAPANVPENLQPYLNSATSVNGLYYVNTRSGTLNLRKQPSSSSSVLTEIPRQTVVTVQYVYDGWAFLEYRGYSGWASMQYLESYN